MWFSRDEAINITNASTINTIASNPAAEETTAWIQLFHLSQQFPEIVYYLYIQNPRFLGIADSGETAESRFSSAGGLAAKVTHAMYGV